MTRKQRKINEVELERLNPPQVSKYKNSLKNSRLDFMESRRRPPHWLSSKGPNYQRGESLISASAIEGHF